MSDPVSSPLTDKEIAELRRLQKEVDEDVHHIDNGAENARDAAAGEALSRLLDEVEELRPVLLNFLCGDGPQECAGKGECVCDDAWPLFDIPHGRVDIARYMYRRRFA